MFLSHEVTLDVPFEMACARLAHLLADDSLHDASQAAHRDGSEALIRVGPFGATAILSKLVRVRTMAPVRHPTRLATSLRWEATGVTGELFPMLDADLTLDPADDGNCRLTLIASYRPPLGQAGAVLDRAVMHRVAAATVRTLLETLGTAIRRPATGAQPQPQPTAAPTC